MLNAQKPAKNAPNAINGHETRPGGFWSSKTPRYLVDIYPWVVYNMSMTDDILRQTLQEIHAIQGPSRILCVSRDDWYEFLIDLGPCLVQVASEEAVFVAVTDELATVIALTYPDCIWDQWTWEEFHATLQPYMHTHRGPMKVEDMSNGLHQGRAIVRIEKQIEELSNRRRK